MGRTDTKAATKAPGSRHAARSHSPSNPPRRSSRPQPLVPVVAIGDVHGCDELLEEELQKHWGSGAELILLGDLIDRAPEPGGDRRVLENVMALQRDPESWGLARVTVLRGNHEQMLLDALDEGKPGPATMLWQWNGGDRDLLAFAAEHREWFEGLPLRTIRGPYLFVHAGVRPGVALEKQRHQDLIWIREPFLNQPHGLPYTVVHGHTITRDQRIDQRPDRINLDTGAFCTGVLSSLLLDPEKAPQKLCKKRAKPSEAGVQG